MSRIARDLTGRVFGLWTVVEKAEPDRNRNTQWRCRCACGGEYAVRTSNLVQGRSRGCMPCRSREGQAVGAEIISRRWREGMIGRTFGNLIVLRESHTDHYNQIHWWVRCSCGTEKSVRGVDLRTGRSTMCQRCAGRLGGRPGRAEDGCTGCRMPSTTRCRICRRPWCGPCLTDHHHEGYGTPADNRP